MPEPIQHHPDLPAPCANDRFARLLGIQITHVEPGLARARMEIRNEHLNGMDRVQGGVIFTLADYCFAAACNSRGVVSVGLTNTISYYKAALGPYLTAEATEISQGNRISGFCVDVRDAQNQLVARMECLSYGKTKE